jgi:hypothetical protein
MAWFMLIVPGVFFLLAFVNWRAYRKHVRAQRVRLR